MICNDCNNTTNLIICSNFFMDFYVNNKYHHGQITQNVIENISKDIYKQL